MPRNKISGSLPDVPWHIGTVHMAEGDTRRDKRRCIWYVDNKHYHNYCSINMVTCPGSSHCREYAENAARVNAARREMLQERAELKEDARALAMRQRANRADIIEYGDLVCLRDCVSKEEFNVKIAKRNPLNKATEAAIIDKLIGRHCGESVFFRNVMYRIIKIIKSENCPKNARTDTVKGKRPVSHAVIEKEKRASFNSAHEQPGTLTCYEIGEPGILCPYDHNRLIESSAQVRQKNGLEGKTTLLKCPVCLKWFINKKIRNSGADFDALDIRIIRK